jgi:hypothetical protein
MSYGEIDEEGLHTTGDSSKFNIVHKLDSFMEGEALRRSLVWTVVS